MSGVAVLRSLGNATAQLSPDGATGTATDAARETASSPMTGRELRAQLRAQQPRNTGDAAPQLERNAAGGERNADDASCAVALPSKRNAATPGERNYWWSVEPVDQPAFSFCSVPELNQSEVEALYPGAVVGIPVDHSDDRRKCSQCANLAPRDQRCLAADRGEKPWGYGPGYKPPYYVPQRCLSFRPLQDDPDQRSGSERWPGLAAGVVTNV